MKVITELSIGFHFNCEKCHYHRGPMTLSTKLARLRCPDFLAPASSAALSALELRRPLLLWLRAVFLDPSARLAEDERWVRDDPPDGELAKWLRSLGVFNADELLEPSIEQEKAQRMIEDVVDAVDGRVLLEENGEAATLGESMRLLDDIASHQASIFSSECQIFPMSIQLQTNDGLDIAQSSLQLGEDVTSLERQVEALRNRVESARDHLEGLRGSRGMIDELPDAKSLSHELVSTLNDTLDLIARVNTMLRDDASCWTDQAKPQLVGLGPASRSLAERMSALLAFFQNTETLHEAVASSEHQDQLANVLAHCQKAVDAIAPELRDQLTALEFSLRLRLK